jgi:XTP/dITP diphosphohydrolase
MQKRLTLLFASTNLNKFNELKPMLPEQFRLINLTDIAWTTEIPEPYETFEENAMAKTGFIYKQTGLTCFAEDSGLEIDALGGRPGVFSARYAGAHGDSKQNNKKVLSEMEGMTHRSARFISVISYQSSAVSCHIFKGIVEGAISMEERGTQGFGYDPVFIPAGFHNTFGELPPGIKQSISHRRRALDLFLEHLHTWS